MPLGVKPICSTCQTSDTPIWRKGPDDEVLCNSCGLKQTANGGAESKSDSNGKGTRKRTSKSHALAYDSSPMYEAQLQRG